MLRRGFTLIELLIVITIIAILAGAAIPYVQDYVEDARIARAKADMDEVRSALIRFELDRGVSYPATTTAILVGPYLDKAPIDPWGVPYCVSATSSVVFTVGPNRDSDNADFNATGLAGSSGDDSARDFRPPLALSKCYWIDVDKSGTVNVGDDIKIRLTRPAALADIAGLATGDFVILINGAASGITFTAVPTAISPDASTATAKEFLIDLANVPAPFIPGRDTINYVTGTTNLQDTAASPFGPNECAGNLIVIQAL